MSGSRKNEEENFLEKFIKAEPSAQIRNVHALGLLRGLDVVQQLKQELESLLAFNEKQPPGSMDLITQRAGINSGIRSVDNYLKQLVFEFSDLDQEAKNKYLSTRYASLGDTEIISLIKEIDNQYKAENSKKYSKPDIKYLHTLMGAMGTADEFLKNPAMKQAAKAAVKTNSAPSRLESTDNDNNAPAPKTPGK